MKTLHIFFVIASYFLIMNFNQPVNAQTGKAHSSIESTIDEIVDQVFKDNPLLPGLTVAASKDGRLVLNKGYGYANFGKKTKMQPYHRSRIGSVSKIITAAGMLKLIEETSNFNINKNLYTEVLTDPDYKEAYLRGVKRHRPVTAIAISNDDKVYTWYANKKFSIGSSSNLDKHSELTPFTLPKGKTVNDIRAIAFSKSNKVYTWYDNETLSIGTPDDLGKYLKSEKVKLPGGKSMYHIVGIAIAKSDNDVYVWYDNGTVSSGTSTDLGKHFAPKSFSTPVGKSRYDIRGIGINKKDHVYYWFSDGKVSSGTSTDLDKYKKPYTYSIPGIPNLILEMALNYPKMEIRHLLSHTAGFVKNGDTKGAVSMFNLPKGATLGNGGINYKKIHLYMLSTRKLLFEPGKSYNYSNHGMGLSGHIISEVSGIPYGQYITKKIFKPLGLNIAPARSPLQFNAAFLHGDRDCKDDQYSDEKPDCQEKQEDNNCKIKTLKWKVDPDPLKTVNGAGGWVSSARDLVRFMCALDKNPNHSDILKPASIDLMEIKPFAKGHALGWVRFNKGEAYKLKHKGAAKGGRAYMAKFSNGYISNDGINIGNINIAICANTETVCTSALKTLSDEIVKAIGKANIASNYDLFKLSREVTFHRVKTANYQGMFNYLSNLGYKPSFIDAYSVGGKPYYNMSWVPASGKAWKSYHGLTASQYQKVFNNRGNLSPTFVESYIVNGKGIFYNVIFEKKSGSFLARHGLNYNQHKAVMNEAKNKGLEPINISVVPVGDQRQYTVLYRNINYGGGWKIKSQVKEADYQKLFNKYKAQGYTPVYINGYKHKGQTFFTTIFAKNGGGLLKAKHGMSGSKMQAEWQKAVNAGYRTKMITAFDGASKLHRFAAFWRK